MFVNGETLIIDMDTISHGHPIFDLANIYVAHVGFGELSPEFVSNYLGYPYDVSVTVWKKFLPQYLETTDENRIKEVENKTKLLAYVRILRHMIRRNEHSTEEGKKKLIYFMDKITELADKIDSFVYAYLGDGEIQEGQIYEAMMNAGHNRLNNLIAIVDRNSYYEENQNCHFYNESFYKYKENRELISQTFIKTADFTNPKNINPIKQIIKIKGDNDDTPL